MNKINFLHKLNISIIYELIEKFCRQLNDENKNSLGKYGEM